jgi:hypothetical protein
MGGQMTAYKVVTQDLKSLGLRKNPHILKYSKRYTQYILTPSRDNKDFGGIWVCKNLSSATKLRKYMKEHYNKVVRIFICEIGEVLYSNSYRIKTDRVRLLQELK